MSKEVLDLAQAGGDAINQNPGKAVPWLLGIILAGGVLVALLVYSWYSETRDYLRATNERLGQIILKVNTIETTLKGHAEDIAEIKQDLRALRDK